MENGGSAARDLLPTIGTLTLLKDHRSQQVAHQPPFGNHGKKIVGVTRVAPHAITHHAPLILGTFHETQQLIVAQGLEAKPGQPDQAAERVKPSQRTSGVGTGHDHRHRHDHHEEALQHEDLEITPRRSPEATNATRLV